MNIIQKIIREAKENVDSTEEESPNPNTMLATLAMPRSPSSYGSVTKTLKRIQSVENPEQKIEDVPFRRQDCRIIDSRKKRITDRKLIRCLILCGMAILMIGLTFLSLFFISAEDYKSTKIFLIVGSVLIILGVSTMLFSVEVCVRLKANSKRVQDPEIDDVDNLHQIKHWIQPEIIPYGWGQECDEVKDENMEEAITAPSTAATMTTMRARTTASLLLTSSDESKPIVQIEPSSPTSQIKGEFEDPNEKIMNLFASKSKASNIV